MAMLRDGRGLCRGWRGGAIAAASLLALATTVSGQCWEVELIGEDCQPVDGLGWAVDISADGTVAAVGAIGHKTPLGGAVFVFERTGDSWQELVELTPDGETGGFGAAVAIRPDGLQVCALDTVGQCCIFTRGGQEWMIAQTLPISAEVGAEIVFSGDGQVLLISTGLGEVHIYEQSPEEWVHVQTIEDTGSSVDVSHNADIIAIGQYPSRTDTAIYRRSDSTWRLEQEFNVGGADERGRCVRLSADGSRFFFSQVASMSGEGLVLVYEYVGDRWLQSQALWSSDPVVQRAFGCAIGCSADGAALVVGDGSDDSVVQSGGSVSIYEWRDGRYEFVVKQLPPNNVSMALFGYDLALTPDGRVLIGGAALGGRGQGDLPVGTGAAYILNIGECSLETLGRGDIDGDFDVDANDLGVLLNAYEKTDAGDVDGDGDTDQHDLGILLKHYNQML